MNQDELQQMNPQNLTELPQTQVPVQNTIETVAQGLIDVAVEVMNSANKYDLLLKVQALAQITTAMKTLHEIDANDPEAELQLKEREFQMNVQMKQMELQMKQQEHMQKMEQNDQNHLTKQRHEEDKHKQSLLQNQESFSFKQEQAKKAAQIKPTKNATSKGGR